MRLLLDTHSLLWHVFSPAQLSAEGKRLILDQKVALFASVASYWEMNIKAGLGKLSLQPTWQTRLQAEAAVNEIAWLAPSLQDCERVGQLPLHHRDPFDRMLIAQAQRADLTILSRDQVFVAYNIAVVW